MFYASRLGDGTAVFLTIVVALLTVALGFFIYTRIKKEAKKIKDEENSFFDGLLTRAQLLSSVSNYIAKTQSIEFTMLSIDMDKFQQFIVAFGKNEADRMLEKVAYSIVSSLPRRVEMALDKEDKFLVFIKGDYSRDESITIAKKILDTIRKPLKVYGESFVNLTASIGICFYPANGRNTNELLKSLEIANYVCKKNGGNNYVIYSEVDTNKTENENLSYYHQIKQAIKNKQFELYYQPIIDAKAGEVYAIEGFLRWNHPEFGVLPPYKFINIMEQSGDINWVGLWGLETLINEHNNLVKKFPGLDLKMTMNLSTKQLSSPEIANDFTKLVKKMRIPAQRLILEIEEFTIFGKLPNVAENIQRLSDLGFMIAVDGMGLDYQALTKLESMPIDIVKIDNFIADSETDDYLKERFTSLLIEYADRENKIIISEKIENMEMLKASLDSGIAIAQGYYFAKPMSDLELDNYIKNKLWAKLIPSSPVKTTVDHVDSTDGKK